MCNYGFLNIWSQNGKHDYYGFKRIPKDKNFLGCHLKFAFYRRAG